MTCRILSIAMFFSGALGLAFVVPAQAQSITLGAGVSNPPAPAHTTAGPPLTAYADTSALVPAADFTPVLSQLLTAQGFTTEYGWTLSDSTVTLPQNAAFNITSYSLTTNPLSGNVDGNPGGHPAGTAFGESMAFTLMCDATAPVVAGASVTEHWLQYVNTSSPVNGYGFQIAGLPGYWQLDNGQVTNGTGATGPSGTAPYYDSNSPVDEPGGFSTPPKFSDFPSYYTGNGTYLHFVDIPVWDIYYGSGSETIEVDNYGISYGFSIATPEPSVWVGLIGSAMMGLAMVGCRRFRAAKA